MVDRKEFIKRIVWVFLATLVTVWVIIWAINTFGQINMINILLLSILVAQIYGDIFDPRRKNVKLNTITVMEEDIQELKDEVEFLKYVIERENGLEFKQLHTESSVFRDLDIKEGEENNEDTDRRRY